MRTRTTDGVEEGVNAAVGPGEPAVGLLPLAGILVWVGTPGPGYVVGPVWVSVGVGVPGPGAGVPVPGLEVGIDWELVGWLPGVGVCVPAGLCAVLPGSG